MRARLDLSYDGTDFSGWAAQPRLRTVEGVLQEALARVVRGTDGQPVPGLRLTVAGRTDAGVHARGQVAHVDIPMEAWRRIPSRSPRPEPEALRERLTGVLPRDIVVTNVSVAGDGFDARFSAMERRYAYRLNDNPETRDPLNRAHVLWHDRPLDVAALREASARVVGLRDFAPFCRPRPGATTIRELKELSWVRPTDGADVGLVVATVRADAFCHSMVRSLVGAVLAVGDGRRDLAWFDGVIVGDERSQAITVAPPSGLTLEHVTYPAPEELAARAELTRAKRGTPRMPYDA